MDYGESIRYIKSIQSGDKIKPGLETIRELLLRLGNPQEQLDVIHIAGTNGKGSVGTFISSALAAGGKKTGRYVSPAVFSDGEKIQWTQEDQTHCITEEEYAELITEMKDSIDAMQAQGHTAPTEFEIETAAAFLAFVKWDCDVVVLEAGMGGRQDATNVISHAVCTVITPVAMDHRKFLGNTIDEIAAEKAGIIKEGVPVVTFQSDKTAGNRIREEAGRRNAPLVCVDPERLNILQSDRQGSLFQYGAYGGIRIRMPGIYQVENAALAFCCLQCVKKQYSISDTDIRKGMERACWHGRFETLCEDPPVVADGAHNPDGMARFLQSVRRYYQGFQKIGVMGVFADKDYEEMCRELHGTFRKIYTVSPPSERGLPAGKLAFLLNQNGERAKACASVTEALRQAVTDCGQGQQTAVFIFGSLSFFREVYEYFYWRLCDSN